MIKTASQMSYKHGTNQFATKKIHEFVHPLNLRSRSLLCSKSAPLFMSHQGYPEGGLNAALKRAGDKSQERRAKKVGYAMNPPHEEKKTTTKRKSLAGLTPEERNLIELLERNMGRELTQQEVNLALRQAKELGEI